MSKVDFDPLFAEDVEQIPLPNAPLVRVLCQIRFTDVLMIKEDDFVAPFQEEIRSEYPIMHMDTAQAFEFKPEGIVARTETIRRFLDADGIWRISLNHGFLSVETSKYVSREDFIRKLEFIVNSFVKNIRPSLILRIGMRYVDRIEIVNGVDIGNLLRPEMGWSHNSGISSHIKHSFSEVSCETKEGLLQSRWGMMPANGTHDPDVMAPIDNRSWFFDMDASSDYTNKARRFDSSEVVQDAQALAARCYAFFRWAVTDEFLKRFGGKV